MNIGVIIIFHNNEIDINPKEFVKHIDAADHIKICFVDNESKDETLEKLLEIKDISANKVSIVQIKKKVSKEAAKRAGARFMFNDFNLNHLGFIDTSVLIEHNYNLNKIVASLCEKKDEIIAFDKKNKSEQRTKSTLFKSVFSVLDYFKYDDLDKSSNMQQSIL